MNRLVDRILVLSIAIATLLNFSACRAAITDGTTPTRVSPPASSPAATPDSAPSPVITLTPTSTSHLDETSFINAMYDQIDRDNVIPEFARLEIVSLYVNKPTFAFGEDEGIVLQLNVFGYPDPKGTKEIATPLIAIGADVADQQKLPLSGIEVVFHRRHTYNPMLVWANTPPWNAEHVFLASLAEE